MHELSIAQSILDIVLEEMRKHGVTGVRVVRLKIGDLTAVVPESLTFCWSIATEGTPAEGSVLDIQSVPIRARCGKCGHEFEIEDHQYLCPQCESGQIQLLSGRELYIQEIEVQDNVAAAGTS